MMVISSFFTFTIRSLSQFLELIDFFIEIFFNLSIVHHRIFIAEIVVKIIPFGTPVIVTGFNIDEFLSKGGICVILGDVVSINETIDLSYHPSITVDESKEIENPNAIREFLDQVGQVHHLSTLSLGHPDSLGSSRFGILVLLQNWIENSQSCSCLFDEEA